MSEARTRWDRKPVLHRHRDALSEIDWRDFERLVADYYLGQGYEVEHNGTGGRGLAFDGGVDLRLRKDGKLTLVQCKRDSVYQTEHNVVNELLGIKVNEGADEAIVVTTGEFTAAARRFGGQGHVRLIDGVELRRMLGHRLERLTPAAPPIQALVERFAWQAVDHIASGRAPRGRSGVRDSLVAVLLLKAGAFLFVLGMGFVVIPAVIKSALAPIAVPRATPTHAAPVSASLTAAPPAYTAAAPAQVTTRPRTAAEQAQRDAEVKAYLERVPELTHYKYSPLDQNREPTGDKSPRSGEATDTSP